MHKTGLMSSGKAMKRMLISLPLFLALVLVEIGYYLKPVASSTQKSSAATSVDIIVSPDQAIKDIDLGWTGDLAVAILSTAKFSAGDVDPASITFAGASTMKVSGGASSQLGIEGTDAGKRDGSFAFQIERRDVNNDGLSDLVAYFSIPYLLELHAGAQQARLSASTFYGKALEGHASVYAFGQSALRGDGGGVTSGPTGNGCTITCPNNVTQGNDTNQCGAVVNYPAPMTTGTCGTVSCSPASGSFFPVGTKTVTCTTSAGPSCSFAVTVVDNTAPTITCPNPVTQPNDPNQCGAVVNYPPPTVGDNCPGVGTPVCSPQSGSFFPVGATTVTCRVSDATTCENIFAVDTSDNLVNFRTSSPGIISSKPIAGLGVNEDVVGIDFRPATGQLYGLVRDTVTTGLRIVTINAATAATAQVGAAFAASGTDFGFDFNPTVDRIRITSDAETNLSVNPDTGAVTVQTSLNPGNPNVVGSAYTNNFVGATVTTLYAIDSGDDTLKTQNPPANGTLSNVGSLGVDTTGNVGFDISQCGGTAYAALETFNNQGPTGGGSSLYTIDLGSGAATLVGGISGNTIRAMSVEMARTSYCSFTVTVFDTQPPSITCPGNINTAAAVSCPIAASSVVTYTTPVPTDNCPGVTVACNPPSGSTFPVGCTTVTCTATDASGNTATCSFQVCVFSFCLQDETNPGNVVLVNVQTGDYIFCCNAVVVATGRGVVSLRGCQGTIEDNKGDRKVEIRFDTSVDGNRGNGSATIKIGTVIRCQITDLNMSNNTCVCSNNPPAGRLDLK